MTLPIKQSHPDPFEFVSLLKLDRVAKVDIEHVIAFTDKVRHDMAAGLAGPAREYDALQAMIQPC
jgi:hypothetical protein